MSVPIELHKAFMPINPTEFEELWDVWNHIDYTPNPLNKKFNIKRKQCTFGKDSYKFAGQVSEPYKGELPSVIKKIFKLFEHDPSYSVIHANFYPDGTAGLQPHSDNEKQMNADKNIYSYTFLSEPGNPRGFQIYDLNGNMLEEHMLDHGDLLVMLGGMQKEYKHGVKKSMAKKYKNLRRINLTVRSWK